MENFGEDFKRLVFESRVPNNSRGTISADLRQYTEASLLVGPTCSNSSKVLARRVTNSTEISLMQLSNGEKATQYAFNGDNMADTLNQNCVGKVWTEEHSNRGVSRPRKE